MRQCRHFVSLVTFCTVCTILGKYIHACSFTYAHPWSRACPMAHTNTVSSEAIWMGSRQEYIAENIAHAISSHFPLPVRYSFKCLKIAVDEWRVACWNFGLRFFVNLANISNVKRKSVFRIVRLWPTSFTLYEFNDRVTRQCLENTYFPTLPDTL